MSRHNDRATAIVTELLARLPIGRITTIYNYSTMVASRYVRTATGIARSCHAMPDNTIDDKEIG